jgi:hypothetical protein
MVALLEEAEVLVRERLDLQRQAEKDRNTLSLRLRTLETELEERETKGLETELHHKAHSEDLNMRVQALEKQIKHNRQFIDVRLDKSLVFCYSANQTNLLFHYRIPFEITFLIIS